MSELKQLPIPDKDVLDAWTDRVATNIDEIILDRIEPQLNELGWFKERTCEMFQYRNALGLIDEYQCSECGADVEGKPNYCPNCGAKVVD